MTMDEAFETLSDVAKATYQRDGHHVPTIVFLHNAQVLGAVNVNPYLDDKPRLKATVRLTAQRIGADGIAFVSEAWMSRIDRPSADGTYLPPSKDPARVDILMLQVEAPGYRRARVWEVDRGTIVEQIEDTRDMAKGELVGWLA